MKPGLATHDYAMLVAVGLFVLLVLEPLRADDAEAPRAIFVMQPDGSAVRRVVFIENFRWLVAPRWSHDGKRLAFAARGPSPSRCLTVDVSGRNLSIWVSADGPIGRPTTSKSSSKRPATRRHPSVQNADGKGSSTLVTGGGPRWSPDGSQIAVLRPLRILDMVQGGERPVFDETDRVAETLGVAWSPDGQRLAAVVRRNTAIELLIVAASEPITAPHVRWQGTLHGGIDWSPDGRRIAVSIRDHQRTSRRLHLLDPDGTDPPELIPGQQGDNCEPAWSPDGGHLAFASSRSDAAGRRSRWPRPGGRLKLVRTHDKGGTVFRAAFSPDSRSGIPRRRRRPSRDAGLGPHEGRGPVEHQDAGNLRRHLARRTACRMCRTGGQRRATVESGPAGDPLFALRPSDLRAVFARRVAIGFRGRGQHGLRVRRGHRGSTDAHGPTKGPSSRLPFRPTASCWPRPAATRRSTSGTRRPAN